MSQSTPINMLRRNQNNDNQSSNTGNMQSGNSNMQQMQPMQQQQQQQQQQQSNMSSDSQLVDDILKEMGESPGMDQQSNINSQTIQYAMDRAQVPPNKYISQQNVDDTNDENNNTYSKKIMMDQQQNQHGFLNQLGFTLSGDSFKEKIMNNMKYPILVFIICFIISLPECNRFIFGFVPKMLLESGQVSFAGVILKAFIGMLLYICISLFI